MSTDGVPLTKHDDALWLKHLRTIGIDVPLGVPAILSINGVDVEFEPMQLGTDGRPTHGLRAVGVNRSTWTTIEKESVVRVRLVRLLPGDGGAIANAAPTAAHSRPATTGVQPTSAIVAEEVLLPPDAMPAFGAYLTVDWSASSTPVSGKDSVWWGAWEWRDGRLALRDVQNPRTRRAATEQISSLLRELVHKRRSVLACFDFPFGYPAGFAATLALDGAPWHAIWDTLGRQIHDDDHNRNNRFDVASALNRAFGPSGGPFWGCPPGHADEHLCSTAPRAPMALRNKRHTEAGSAQPVWKLFGNGSVGSQALVGIPCLKKLRDDEALKDVVSVWPFETGCTLPPRAEAPRVILAEIYPSMVPLPVDLAGHIKDRAQIEAIARHLACHDSRGTLHTLFEAPRRLPPEALHSVVDEEGWILGVLPEKS